MTILHIICLLIVLVSTLLGIMFFMMMIIKSWQDLDKWD